jgi:hypothetical protein
MYRRGQIHAALWGLVSQTPNRSGEIPPRLERRPARLLDKGVGVMPSIGAKSGLDRQYSLADGVEVAVALSLMNVAWSQADVSEFVSKNRTTLRNRIEQIDTKAGTRTLLWIFPQPAITPILASAETFRPSLVHYVPRFSSNHEEEAEQLKLFDFGWRERIVLNVSEIKRTLAENLAIAPIIRRGRQPKETRHAHAS